MIVKHNISAQDISWVKSNKSSLNSIIGIKNLFYPETTSELVELINEFHKKKSDFDIIGYSSNTLFLPSYFTENMICTKKLKRWVENDKEIICESGVNVSLLSKAMVKRGFCGFEGLTDLPGTIAAGVYGNAGCRGCSVIELVKSFVLLLPDGTQKEYSVEDLKPTYRSTSLKRKELTGQIISVTLIKKQGDPAQLLEISKQNHEIRLAQQPSAANNLGTTFIGSIPTRKGKLYMKVEKILQRILGTTDTKKTFPLLLKLTGHACIAKYVYCWNRYMFLDAKSHTLFPKYVSFIKSLYADAHLEIEIRK